LFDDLVLIDHNFLAKVAAAALIVELMHNLVGDLIRGVGIVFVDDVSQLHMSVKLIL
jgi:hypothetical protein